MNAIVLSTDSIDTAILFTAISSNVKTGKIPVTTSSRHTCAPSCPLRGVACYAENAPLVYVWNNLTKAGPNTDFKSGVANLHSLSWDGLCASVSALPINQLWRHNQAGDLPHNNGVIDSDMVRALVAANIGKRGFTYTHHDMSIAANRDIIEHANDNGFAVNLSADNLAEVDTLADLAIAPVVSLVSIEYQRKEERNPKGKMEFVESLSDYKERMLTLPHTSPNGRVGKVCPATYLDDKTCANCKLCAVIDRNCFVMFPGHGARKKNVAAIVASYL